MTQDSGRQETGKGAEKPQTGPANPANPAPGVVLVFDGHGGVQQAEAGANTDPVGRKGFVLVAGDARSPEFAAWLNEALGEVSAETLSETLIETQVSPNLRSRCTVVDNRAMMVLHLTSQGADTEEAGGQLMTLWIEKGRAILISDLDILAFFNVAQWQKAHYAPVSPADLVVRLGLRAADHMEPLVERMGDALDDVEEAVLLAHTIDSRAQLAQLRRKLIGFRKVVWPLRDVLNTLEIEDLSFFSARDRLRLREASSRVARIGDELLALAERAVLVHEQVMDSRAEQMNRTMLVLTAVTVVFMPLTVISGMLGMNVAGIPLSNNPWGFTIVSTALVTIGVGTLVWMRARKWL